MASSAPRTYSLSPAVGTTTDANADSFVVRSATPDDAERVLECAREVFVTSPYVLTSPGEFSMTLEQEREFITKLHEHPRQIMLVAEHVGHVVGILVLTQNTAKRKLRHTLVLGMSIREAYRGRRVGTAMMREAVEWAEANPEVQIITLGVYAANAPAMALYTRFGFVEYGRLPGALMHDDGTAWENVDMYRRV